MKIIGITIITLLLAVPAAGQDLPGSVDDLRALRAQSDGPIIKVNGNTCFVSRAQSYAPSCWPSRPEHRPLHSRIPWGRVATVGFFAATGGMFGLGAGAEAIAVASKIGAIGGVIIDAEAHGDLD